MDRCKTVGFQTRKLSNILRRAMDCSAGIKQADTLTGVHGWVLGYLYEKELMGIEVYQKNLEKEFGIRRSTVTEMLKLMEKNGLIKRESVQSDARLKRIVLTHKGKETHLLVVRDIESMEKAATEGLSQSEIDSFFAIIAKIKGNIEAYIQKIDKEVSDHDKNG